MHEISSGFLDAKTKEQAIAEVQDIVDRKLNSDYYDYGGDFTYYDKTFTTEDEAYDFLSQGYGEGGICKVKTTEPSKSLQKNIKKLQDLEKEEREWEQDYRAKCIEKFKERTSATCSCDKCESRYKKEIALQYKLYCPVCRNWMVSTSVKEYYDKQMAKIRSKRDTLQKEVEQQRRAELDKSNRTRFFYVLDFHC